MVDFLFFSNRSVCKKIICIVSALLISYSLSACDDPNDNNPSSNKVSIPNVVGLDLRQAMQKLSAAGFKNVKRTSTNGKMVLIDANWDVSNQAPVAGTKVSNNTEIKLLVNNERIEKKKEAERNKAKQESEDKGKKDSDTKTKRTVDGKTHQVKPVPKPARPKPSPKPAPKSKPAPKPARPKPAPKRSTNSGGSAYYKNCAAVRRAGKAPLHRGEPGYRSGLDRDGDGIACE